MRKIFFMILLLLVHSGNVKADCSSLAHKFANDVSLMSDNDLASLRKCVDDTLQERLFSSGATMVPAPPHPVFGGPGIVPAPSTPTPSPPIMPVNPSYQFNPN